MLSVCARDKREGRMGVQAQEEWLGTEPLGRLMARMAIPSVAAQVINVLYNIVDRVYIGHIPEIGFLALSGVGITFPIITLVTAFGAFSGRGGAPLASICLGMKDYDGAERILGTCTAFLLAAAVLLMAVFYGFQTPLLYAFGASDTLIGYAREYLSIYLLGTPFALVSVGLNTFISGQGNAKVAMVSVMSGAFLNLLLDPVLIFWFGLGVRGAAAASVVSQAVSAAIILWFLCSKRSVIRLKGRNVRLQKQTTGRIAALGVSPFVMQSTESLVTITLNSGLQAYGGDLYVGAMSILSSVLQLIAVPTQGITQGVQPIISYNYGAGNKDRVKGAVFRMMGLCLLTSLVLGGLAVLAPGVYVQLFTTNGDLAALTKEVMPVFFLGMCIFGLQDACQGTFLALNQAKISVFIATLRKIILLIPLAILLPKGFGVFGIFCAEPIADTLSVLTTITLFTLFFKHMIEPKNAGKEASALRK